eukprot:CAMPEP_0194372642 /NCGR_PEP_ID=MMETSP0174-20130528/21030_1 /TAXON_ID=216777 /ORGANISM="Proboscia alata, Strain PI-D3" /LENGTH=109 /DNA_ID=CAMNT_0039151283 /DNA_START=34 /DNA_END=360 /DNA_ORIENTATION=+
MTDNTTNALDTFNTTKETTACQGNSMDGILCTTNDSSCYELSEKTRSETARQIEINFHEVLGSTYRVAETWFEGHIWSMEDACSLFFGGSATCAVSPDDGGVNSMSNNL